METQIAREIDINRKASRIPDLKFAIRSIALAAFFSDRKYTKTAKQPNETTNIPVSDMRRNGENPNNPEALSVGKDASQANAIIPSIKDRTASIRIFFRMKWILLQSVGINFAKEQCLQWLFSNHGEV
ncbi:MAG: hypothetical protein M3R47_12240 [Chloroflexota bacterium]|nr:hypothetical protein [Chloroflexota bacterium]